MHPSPIAQFAVWLADAQVAGVREPEAMALATADGAGRPAVRMLLLRGFDEAGFRFFTNYRSRKGEELAANPHAAAVFHWDRIDRQVRIEGPVVKLTAAESDEYFATRPRESRLGAWASSQSRPIPDRAALLAALEEAGRRFPGEVPRPPHWGGYRLEPQRVEFWVAGEFRLHDRFLYERAADAWTITRLSP